MWSNFNLLKVPPSNLDTQASDNVRLVRDSQRSPNIDATAEMIAQCAIPIRQVSSEMPKVPFPRSRVLAFGEATHGTREFFRLRDIFLRSMADREQITILALEASFSRCITVDDYLVTGFADAVAVVSELDFWTLRIPEMVDTFSWMREYNSANPSRRPLRCIGFDFQDLPASLRRLLNYLLKVDHNYAMELEEVTWPPTPDRIDRILALIPSIGSRLLRNQQLYEGIASSEEWRTSRQLHRNLVQFAEVASAGAAAEALRDRFMAENISWILSTFPDDRLVIWSHNGHIAAADVGIGFQPMGLYLRTALGADYTPVALTFDRGAFRAVDLSVPESPSLRPFSVGPALEGTIEAILRSAGLDSFFLSFECERGIPEWLMTPRRFRMIGADFAPEREALYYTLCEFRSAYDAVVFVSESTPTNTLEQERR